MQDRKASMLAVNCEHFRDGKREKIFNLPLICHSDSQIVIILLDSWWNHLLSAPRVSTMFWFEQNFSLPMCHSICTTKYYANDTTRYEATEAKIRLSHSGSFQYHRILTVYRTHSIHMHRNRLTSSIYFSICRPVCVRVCVCVMWLLADYYVSERKVRRNEYPCHGHRSKCQIGLYFKWNKMPK